MPAGTLDTILAACLLCFVSMGRSRLSWCGEGVRGVLKGCAAAVEVAAGLSLGRGFVAVVSCADTACARDEDVCVNVRTAVLGMAEVRLPRRCRQRWQIMIVCIADGFRRCVVARYRLSRFGCRVGCRRLDLQYICGVFGRGLVVVARSPVLKRDPSPPARLMLCATKLYLQYCTDLVYPSGSVHFVLYQYLMVQSSLCPCPGV